MKPHGNATHGMTDTKEYRAWENMKKRCHKPTDSHYPNWGGRGIYVCDRWRHSFETFFADMGYAPSKDHSIERIDNDGPYSPENCQWIPMAEQAANQRKTIHLTYNGVTRNLSAWARHIGIDRSCLQARIDNGWPVEKALTLPPKAGNRLNGVHITYNGETQSLSEWARRFGINTSMLSKRIKRGVPIEIALSKPSRKGRFISNPW